MASVSPSRNGWAAPSYAPRELMASFQEGLPIRLIATERPDLQICRADEALADVMERNTEGFDCFPVVDSSAPAPERIVGLIELAKFSSDEFPNGRVADHMTSLCEANLIGADASILSFLKSADHNPYRLVVSGARIDGLVTLSDLQKLPVRAALFALITDLEMTMAEAIRRECEQSLVWKERLSSDRLAKVNKKISDTITDDSWIDDLLYTEFSDKKIVLVRSDAFNGSKTAFKLAMEKAEQLRNKLAHANEYANSRDAARQTCETVRKIEHWIEWLRNWPLAVTGTEG